MSIATGCEAPITSSHCCKLRVGCCSGGVAVAVGCRLGVVVMAVNYVVVSIVSVHQGRCAAVQNTPMSNTASTVTIFGISNCDTVKKARVWLNEHGVNAVFHDFKQSGLPNDAELDSWFAAQDWTTVINTKGTTWRKLDAATQHAVVDAVSATALTKTYPSVIKRPVVRWPNGRITVGFVPTDWRALID